MGESTKPSKINVIPARMQRQELAEEAVNLIRKAQNATHCFVDVRKIWDGIGMIGSVNHLNPTVQGWNLYPSRLLKEIEESISSYGLTVLNMAHDLAIPHYDTPKGHIFDIIVSGVEGHIDAKMHEQLKQLKEWAILDAEVPYGLQLTAVINPKTINIKTIKDLFEMYGASKPEEVRTLLALFEVWSKSTKAKSKEVRSTLHGKKIDTRPKSLREMPLEKLRNNGIIGVTDGYMRNLIADFRHAQYGIVEDDGVHFKRETPTTSLLPKIIEALKLLEGHGYPFYKSPLEDTVFADTGHLSGVDGGGVRQKVTFENNYFQFSDRGTTIKIQQKEIYAYMERKILVPTVPTLVLALITAPEIPHLGGSSMQDYAPRLIEVQSKWLGISDPEGAAGRLLVSAQGQTLFSVRYEDNELSYSLPVAFLTLGRAAIMDAVRKDSHVDLNIANAMRQMAKPI